MSRDIQTRRSYRSPLREEQARATRRAVVEAARDLFVERGYAATTIDAVAERAGVSRKTVFSAVGGKAGLLKLAFDWSLAGDDEPVALADRPQIQEMMAQRDPARLVGLQARLNADIARRLAFIHPVLVAAADVDPEARALQEESERNRRGGAGAFVTRLAELGGLRADLDVQRGTEVVEVVMDPMPYRRLVEEGSWTFEDYVGWLEGILRSTLLDA